MIRLGHGFFFTHVGLSLTQFRMALISDMKIAILATHGARQDEIAVIREQLEQSGITVLITAPVSGEIDTEGEKRNRMKIDLGVSDAVGKNLDGLIIPGTTSDALISSTEVLHLISQTFRAGKVIGVMGSGIAVAIAAGLSFRAEAKSREASGEADSRTKDWSGNATLTVDENLIIATRDTNPVAFVMAFSDLLRARIRKTPPVAI